MFRDNAEVHRLQSLKNLYVYHTEIEEECLEKFKSYCNSMIDVGNVHDKKQQLSLPTINQVIYFELLDKWALWLDSKTPQIQRCSLENSKELKESIINSFDEFSKSHPIVRDEKKYFEVDKQWINSPQSLLTIGIIQMYHHDGFEEANKTFDKVISFGYQFAGEALYYKACMRMKNFEAMRTSLKSIKLAKKKCFEMNIDEAANYFNRARIAFVYHQKRIQNDAAIVTDLIEQLPQGQPKVLGFTKQINSKLNTIELIIKNIDHLIGSPFHSKMFQSNKITEEYSNRIYSSLCQQGLISPILLIKESKIDNLQFNSLRHKFKLNYKQIMVF
jgi:hypothetical protein